MGNLALAYWQVIVWRPPHGQLPIVLYDSNSRSFDRCVPQSPALWQVAKVAICPIMQRAKSAVNQRIVTTRSCLLNILARSSERPESMGSTKGCPVGTAGPPPGYGPPRRAPDMKPGTLGPGRHNSGLGIMGRSWTSRKLCYHSAKSCTWFPTT